MNRTRFITIAVLVITAGLAVTAIWIGTRLSQQTEVTPSDTEAASEQVTNADKLKTKAQREAFAQRWADFMADQTHDVWDYIEYALTDDGGRYECKTAIMDSVGEETLYGCDLNVIFVLHDFENYITTDAIGPQNASLNAILDELITQSGLLQKAAELGYMVLDSTFFNNPDKNHLKRLEQVKVARDQIGDQFVKTVDFEAIVIYFHNQQDPEIPLDQAKAAAKAKMDILYSRLQSGSITMEQAGAEIASDNIIGDTTGISLIKLDPVYDGNAYMKILGHQFDQQIFIDSTYDEELKSLGEGQFSTVRLFKDYSFADNDVASQITDENIEMVESGYIIFRLIKINFGLQSDFSGNSMDEVEEKIKNNYDDVNVLL